MLTSKTVDNRLGKILDNCTGNLYMVKKLPCGVICQRLGIVGPCLFEDKRGQTVTVISERCVTMLQNFFIPYLDEKEMGYSKCMVSTGLSYCSHSENFDECNPRNIWRTSVIFRNCDIPWPPRYPDVSPYDFFLWGHLKF